MAKKNKNPYGLDFRVPLNPREPPSDPPPPPPDVPPPQPGYRTHHRRGSTWQPSYTLPTAPDWWEGITTRGNATADQKYVMAAVALLPFMSPEDQRSMLSSINQMIEAGPTAGVPKNQESPFGDILSIPFEYGSTVTPDMYSYYTSAERANEMLAALDTMLQSTRYSEAQMGPGYQFLTEVADALRDFGGQSGAPMSRQQYQQFVSTIEPLLAQAQGNEDLSMYAGLARAIALPFLSAGPLYGVTDSGTFGLRNTRLFG